MSANYLNQANRRKSKSFNKNSRNFKKLFSFMSLFVIFAVFVSGLVVVNVFSNQSKTAYAFDPVKEIVCNFEEGSFPRVMYDFTQGNAFEFSMFSKSPVVGGGNSVDGGLNAILESTGMDFTKTNEMIIGQPMDRTGQILDDEEDVEPPTEEEMAENFNKGPLVSVFDRFGMIGTSYTAYNGEWRYLTVDACAGGEALDLHLGEFYDDRLEPRSTWEDRDGSEDPRTQQHAYGWNAQFWKGFLNLTANLMLWFTKFITTMTIALINFSFSDISGLLGIDTMLAGDGSSNGDGLFQKLYESLYTPLIVIIMTITGMRIVWVGLAKRQFREALSSAAISILMFLLAILVFTIPGFFVKAPNQVAVALQSIIVTSFAGGMAGSDGLCTTDVGAKTITEGTSGMKDQDLLTRSSENMRSAIGCTFWQTFVFKPWVEGQWGTNYNDLWADGFAPSGGKELGNDNQEMVGDAAVPIGDGKFINNWAIFQISTQSEAHAPLGYDGNYSKITNNVSNDWWRIVDAVSNYNETENKQLTENSNGVTKEFEYMVPDTSKLPLVYWDTWAGNNGWGKIGAAFSSIFIGVVGMLAPLVFSFLAALYAVGLGIIMAFAPIALLFGAWGSRGFNIFKQWGLLFIKVFMNRIGTAIMLMLSIVFTNAAITMMQNVNWWSGMLLLVVTSIVLIMSRHKIMDALTSFGLGPSSFQAGVDRISGAFTKTAKSAGRVVSGATAGAIHSKAKGGTFMQGVRTGGGQEFKNLTQSNNFAMNARRQYESTKLESGQFSVDRIVGDKVCRICMKPLKSSGDLMLGSNGNYIHKKCYYDNEDITRTEFPDEIFNELSMKDQSKHRPIADRRKMFKKQNEVDDNFDKSRDIFIKNIAPSGDEENKVNKSEIVKNTVTHELMPEVNDAIKRLKAKDSSIQKIAVPTQLHDVLPQELIDSAVNDKDYETVKALFSVAFARKLSEAFGKSFESELLKVQSEILAEVQNPALKTPDNRIDKSFTQELQANRNKRYGFSDKTNTNNSNNSNNS